MTSCHDVYDEDFQPRHLVVGVDDSPGARAALSWALEQARVTGRRVMAVNVIEPVMPLDFAGTGFYTSSVVDSRSVREAAQKMVDQMVHEATTDGDVSVWTRVVEGHSPGQVLVRAARDASMLVVGTHHRHGLGYLLGSTGASCVRHATCPVVAVPETWSPRGSNKTRETEGVPV